MSDSQMVHAGPGVTGNKTLYNDLFRNKNYSFLRCQQLTGKEKQEKENLQTRRRTKEKKM